MPTIISTMGRAVKDGESRTTKKGTAMGLVTIAVPLGRPNAADDARDEPLFIRLVAFGALADDAASVRKGDMCSAVGKLERRVRTDKDGARRDDWQCVLDAMLSSRSMARPQARSGGE